METREERSSDDPIPPLPRHSTPTFTDALAHPGFVFGDPMQVVDHPLFSDQEKRTVLLSWARDELVVEEVALKAFPEIKAKSQIDGVLAALSRFDALAVEEYSAAVATMRARIARLSPFRVPD